MSTRLSAGVDDCPYYTFYYYDSYRLQNYIYPYTFFDNNYNIGELNSAKNDHKYYFAGAATHQ